MTLGCSGLCLCIATGLSQQPHHSGSWPECPAVSYWEQECGEAGCLSFTFCCHLKSCAQGAAASTCFLYIVRLGMLFKWSFYMEKDPPIGHFCTLKESRRRLLSHIQTSLISGLLQRTEPSQFINRNYCVPAMWLSNLAVDVTHTQNKSSYYR